MSEHVTKCKIGTIVIILVVATMFLAACGGKPAAAPSPTPAPPPPAPTPAPPKIDPTAQRAKGQEIYQKTAGGVGCQACHGADGRGTNSGPNIRGKTADDIKRALGGDAMNFIRLTEDDIQAVAIYLTYLSSQP